MAGRGEQPSGSRGAGTRLPRSHTTGALGPGAAVADGAGAAGPPCLASSSLGQAPGAGGSAAGTRRGAGGWHSRQGTGNGLAASPLQHDASSAMIVTSSNAGRSVSSCPSAGVGAGRLLSLTPYGKDEAQLEAELEKELEEEMTEQMARGVFPGLSSLTSGEWRRHEPRTLKGLVSSARFDMAIGFVIVANSLTIGLEQSFRIEGDREVGLQVIGYLEHIFLGVYILELALRLCAFGCSCLRDNWVRFDAVLVLLGVCTLYVLEPLLGQVNDLAPLMVLRTMRLLRLARMVRLLVKFRVLWMLIRGLLNSAGTMFYTLTLLLIMLYVFSAVGIEIITNSPYAVGPTADEEFSKIAKQYFGSLLSTMLTLMQFVCLDSIGEIYRPLIKKDLTLALYFAMIILVVPIVVMNLVTAIIVNSALEQAVQDKESARTFEEQRRARLIKKLQLIFRRLDDDQSGQVSREEIANVNEGDMMVLCESTNIADPMEIFDALDIDGTGEIDIDEFCNSIWQVVASGTPLEVQRMEKQVNVIYARIKEVEARQSAMQQVIDQIIQVQEAMQDLLCGGAPGSAPGGAPAGAASSRRAGSKAGGGAGGPAKTAALRPAAAQDSPQDAAPPAMPRSRQQSREGSAAFAAAGRAASLESLGSSCGGSSAASPKSGGHPRGAAELETIQESMAVEPFADLLREGTEACEGAPPWAKELLAELRRVGSLELAELCCANEEDEVALSMDPCVAEEAGGGGGGSCVPPGLAIVAAEGPPHSARPLLIAGWAEPEEACYSSPRSSSECSSFHQLPEPEPPCQPQPEPQPEPQELPQPPPRPRRLRLL